MKAKYRTYCPACHGQVLRGEPIIKIGATWGHLRCAPCTKPSTQAIGRKLTRRRPPPTRTGCTRTTADRERHLQISRLLGDHGRER